MSIILDALKKAQEERKKITQIRFPKMGGGKSTKKQNLAFYAVVAGLVCLILVVLFYPVHKKTAQVQTAVPKVQPITIEPPPKVEAAAKVQPLPKVEAKVESSKKTEVFVKDDTGANIPKMQRTAAYVPRKKTVSKLQTPASGKGMLPQEDTGVALRKVDDEKIMNTFNEAVEESKNGRLEVAKGLYMSILQEKPDYVEAINNLGIIAMKQDNMDEALSYFRKCLGYRKDYAKAYNNIGLVLMNKGEKKTAEEYFSKSIEVDRDKIEPYLNLAAIMREEKRYDEASRLLESLVGRQVRNGSVYLSLALIKDEMGRHNDAIQYYRYYLGMGGGREERNKVINRLKTLEESKAAINIRE